MSKITPFGFYITLQSIDNNSNQIIYINRFVRKKIKRRTDAKFDCSVLDFLYHISLSLLFMLLRNEGNYCALRHQILLGHHSVCYNIFFNYSYV